MVVPTEVTADMHYWLRWWLESWRHWIGSWRRADHDIVGRHASASRRVVAKLCNEEWSRQLGEFLSILFLEEPDYRAPAQTHTLWYVWHGGAASYSWAYDVSGAGQFGTAEEAIVQAFRGFCRAWQYGTGVAEKIMKLSQRETHEPVA